ncbi:hypothetical protein QQS21_001806 [Conoideocrella luteorostrata]|uniref:DnaJ-domain-containing protein n=1 Tax=Conoideocrella luteorostrata TaxID=1105319 RepID=A0AAJ0CZA8_9HYPO|nr:hypothetical protein QQS21_001806 [Conoideocrella luteorostrata]
MGAQQSVPGAAGNGATLASKTCYYELLGVERDVTDGEKALELHPDRNLNDVQEATRKFAEIQAAYEILSDSQERAWYDSHRDAIIAGNDDLNSCTDPTTFHNIRLTTTEEILNLIRKFNSTIPFDDESAGFFGVVRETFQHLALEEETAAEIGQIDCPDYPTFGSSDDGYETVVKLFYSSWSGFSTKKSFSWKDKYRLSDAPDRRIRRLMEKDNKKCREDAIRQFNEAVRFLVAFVRKRDPRYLPNIQTDAERQKSLRNAAASQAARSRAINQQNIGSYERPVWTQTGDNSGHEDDYFSEIEQDSDTEILECAVCNKSFKSIQQLQAHERSKKHVKAVQILCRQMEKEGIVLGLDTSSAEETGRTPGLAASQRTRSFGNSRARDGSHIISKGEAATCHSGDGTEEEQAQMEISNSSSEEDTDDYAPRTEVEERLGVWASSSRSCLETDTDSFAFPENIKPDSASSPTKNKAGMAKVKRRKKAARQFAEADAQLRCNVCHAIFTSRSNLFDHIRHENHASVATTTSGSSKGKKK